MSFSKSESESRTGADVWDVQVPFLRRLYQNAANLGMGQIGPMGEAATGLANELVPRLTNATGTLAGIAGGQGPGMEYLTRSLGQENPYVESVIDSLGGDINRQLGRQIGAGVAGEAAGMGGAFGSSRHGIREGMLQEEALRSFSDAAGQIRYGDYASQAARAEALTNLQMTGARGVGALAPAAYNLGIAPYQAQWLPLAQWAAIMGRPTLLQEGRSDADSFGFSL